MIIAIDGTASSGKGSLAKNLSKSLNLHHLDSGLFYRVLAYQAIKMGIERKIDLIELSKKLSIKKIIKIKKLAGENLRSTLVSKKSSQIAPEKNIREALIKLQREYVNQFLISHDGVVIDGRDIGTIVFPDAKFKFYLDADIKIRAERRTQQLIHLKYKVIYHDVLNDLICRDKRDKKRVEGPLKKAKDAFYIDTGNKSEEFVLQEVLTIIKSF